MINVVCLSLKSSFLHLIFVLVVLHLLETMVARFSFIKTKKRLKNTETWWQSITGSSWDWLQILRSIGTVCLRAYQFLLYIQYFQTVTHCKTCNMKESWHSERAWLHFMSKLCCCGGNWQHLSLKAGPKYHCLTSQLRTVIAERKKAARQLLRVNIPCYNNT